MEISKCCVLKHSHLYHPASSRTEQTHSLDHMAIDDPTASIIVKAGKLFERQLDGNYKEFSEEAALIKIREKAFEVKLDTRIEPADIVYKDPTISLTGGFARAVPPLSHGSIDCIRTSAGLPLMPYLNGNFDGDTIADIYRDHQRRTHTPYLSETKKSHNKTKAKSKRKKANQARRKNR